jgi:amidophosphoribosyltransferase
MAVKQTEIEKMNELHFAEPIEECGVFGICGTDDAAAQTALGLHALQHRGQEAAGIISCETNNDRSLSNLHHHHAIGKVGDNFSSKKVIDLLKGKSAIGHNRYSTTGESSSSNVANIQPIVAELSFGALAVAHNGNLTNAGILRKELVNKGSIFRTTMDTEVIIHLMAKSGKSDIIEALKEALKYIEGAFSLILLNKDYLIGARDPHGVRPLMLGKVAGSYILASETCAFDIIAGEYIRDIEPGEIVIIDKRKLRQNSPEEETITSIKYADKSSKFCIFEFVYFSRPDSKIETKDVYGVRKEMGRYLAREKPVDADIVIPVPDSGVAAALGYSEEAKIPFELGIIRNHYVGRTFIEPSDTIRHFGVKLKHNANRSVIEGKRVILIDDSIVRGTTSKKIVNMVREAGAKEVHMRIACPPTTDSCFYGIDTPSKDKLLASHMTVDEIADFIGADSLAYMTTDSLYKAVGEAKGRNASNAQYCDACLTGEYPIEVKDNNAKHCGC